MTTTTDPAPLTPAARYAERRGHVARLLEMLGTELGKHDEDIAAFPDRWCYADALRKAREDLLDLVAYLAAVRRGDVEAALYGPGRPASPVLAADGCPGCGERDPDRLIWVAGEGEDPETVRCVTCGIVYAPPCSSR